MELIDADRALRSLPGLGRSARRLFRTRSGRTSARRTCASDRRAYRQLLALDDRMLRDIGITRDMVRHEMCKPFIRIG